MKPILAKSTARAGLAHVERHAVAAPAAGGCCAPAPRVAAPAAAAASGGCCAPAPRAAAPVASTGGCCAPASAAGSGQVSALWNKLDKPLAGALLIVLAIALFIPHQLNNSLAFTGGALVNIAPWLAVSVAFAAYAKASKADTLIARAFVGSPTRVIVMGSIFGALSPFCSCGVVPVIAGLLGAGVPLAGVMAFWMASPLMDPEMFGMIAASLGMEFAVVKTVAALCIGVFGGIVTHFVVTRGFITDTLKALPAGCCVPNVGGSGRPQWNVFGDAAARIAFMNGAASNAWFLLRWMAIAFLLESLMIAYVPAEKVVGLLGENAAAIPLAVLVGVPSYLNGYAAIPLVRGLIDLGMSPAVALSFLISGGVTSIPAATAVWALVKPRVFALYLSFAFVGSLAAGYGYSALLALH
ncbi:MAG: permease [Telluria sp.]